MLQLQAHGAVVDVKLEIRSWKLEVRGWRMDCRLGEWITGAVCCRVIKTTLVLQFASCESGYCCLPVFCCPASCRCAFRLFPRKAMMWPNPGAHQCAAHAEWPAAARSQRSADRCGPAAQRRHGPHRQRRSYRLRWFVDRVAHSRQPVTVTGATLASGARTSTAGKRPTWTPRGISGSTRKCIAPTY